MLLNWLLFKGIINHSIFSKLLRAQETFMEVKIYVCPNYNRDSTNHTQNPEEDKISS